MSAGRMCFYGNAAMNAEADRPCAITYIPLKCPYTRPDSQAHARGKQGLRSRAKNLFTLTRFSGSRGSAWRSDPRGSWPYHLGRDAMKNLLSDVCAFVVLGAGMALHSPIASAIDSAQDAIATPAYIKNMRTQSIMDKIDTNGDHVVSHEEGEAYFTKMFDTLDRDHNGTLDRKEWVGAAHEKDVVDLSDGGYARALSSMEMMKMVDSDNDHTVSKQEFLIAHDKIFKKMADGKPDIDAQHFLANHFPK
jgi:Ca2+-binding EF-hand superfamily protein